MNRIAILSGAVALALGLAARPAQATMKGLNQIVTPDIQPAGKMSLSVQAENSQVGNSEQFQAELGLSKRFEVAWYAGFHPGDNLFHAEYGLIQEKHLLLSTGFLNWSARGASPQVFLESGYYTGPLQTMFGAINAQHHLGILAGSAYQVTPRVQIEADYQSGQANFATAGFTWTMAPNLQLNPALYISNSSPHKAYPYAVMTWTFSLWNPEHKDKPAAAKS